jgi:hypothetical protein
MTEQNIQLQMEQQALSLTQGFSLETPEAVDGISQAQADARYVRLPATGVPAGYVATCIGSGQAEWRAPTIPLASTNW